MIHLVKMNSRYLKPLNFQNILNQIIKELDGFLLIFSKIDENSFIQLNGYLELIRREKFGFSLPIVLVGTKVDLVKKEIIKKEVAESFAKKIGAYYFETSVKNDNNIDEIFEKLFERCIFEKEYEENYNPTVLSE